MPMSGRSMSVRAGTPTANTLIIPAFLKLVGNIKGKTVLDAGCGEGYNTRIFARMGAKITGIDISPAVD